MIHISPKNLTKNLDYCKIRTFMWLIKRRDRDKDRPVEQASTEKLVCTCP
jgi:hypothetical protein